MPQEVNIKKLFYDYCKFWAVLKLYAIFESDVIPLGAVKNKNVSTFNFKGRVWLQVGFSLYLILSIIFKKTTFSHKTISTNSILF